MRDWIGGLIVVAIFGFFYWWRTDVLIERARNCIENGGTAVYSGGYFNGCVVAAKERK